MPDPSRSWKGRGLDSVLSKKSGEDRAALPRFRMEWTLNPGPSKPKGPAPENSKPFKGWATRHSSIYIVTTFKEPGRNVALKSGEALDNIASIELAAGQALN